MKKLLLFTCLLCNISAFAQSQNKDKAKETDIMKCINSLKKGDIIQFGPKSGPYFYTYMLEDKTNINDGFPSLIRVSNDLSSKEYKVKNPTVTDSKVTDYFDEAKYVVISLKKGLLGVAYYVDVYGAIESGEIIIKKCQVHKTRN
jgi:hypothetical protein